jgi:hypothetical protein
MPEKKKNWICRHWILSIIFLIISIFIAAIIFSPSETTKTNSYNNPTEIKNEERSQIIESLITKSLDKMLPTLSELPTEFSIGEKEDILKNSSILISRNAEEGFESGKKLYISKYKRDIYSVTDYVEVTFGIYKFNSSKYASTFQKIIVSEIKNEGGYEEVSISSNAECFAWKQDYGYSTGKIGESICYNKNIVFWTSVSMVNTFEDPDSYIKDMTKIVDNKVR